ncbi:MAG TPA: Uma2 family endonuclease [Vicinamibacterales bacterium]|nr:Uma2 family endonuclease [Vicinamibacterales bacterium]
MATPESVAPQELIFGALRVADSPSPTHQTLVAALFLALHEHVSARALGTVWFAPLDVILDAEQALVVQPDLFFIANDGVGIVADKVRGAPDLVIEVLSPKPRIGDVEERVAWFRDYGVRECWLVHQIKRTVDVLQFERGRVMTTREHHAQEPIASGVLPSFDRTLGAVLGY